MRTALTWQTTIAEGKQAVIATENEQPDFWHVRAGQCTKLADNDVQFAGTANWARNGKFPNTIQRSFLWVTV